MSSIGDFEKAVQKAQLAKLKFHFWFALLLLRIKEMPKAGTML